MKLTGESVQGIGIKGQRLPWLKAAEHDPGTVYPARAWLGAY